MKRLSTFVAAFFLFLAAPALASESDVISGNPSVKAVQSHGRTVISFKGTAGRRLFRGLASREIRLICQPAQIAPASPLASADNDDFVAPKHGGKLRAILEGDWCEVLLVRKHRGVKPIVAVALTPAGSVFLDERKHAVVVDGLVTGATVEAGSGSYPTAEQFLAQHAGVIALASPSDPVPAASTASTATARDTSRRSVSPRPQSACSRT